LYPLTMRCFEFGERVAYSLEELDFLAAYVLPEDAWFILPVRAVAGHTTLLLRLRVISTGIATRRIAKRGTCSVSLMESRLCEE
jgi:hypothetical protein